MKRLIATTAAFAALCAGLATGGSPAGAAAPKPTILLVHGAFSDASPFAAVTLKLRSDGYNVIASQIPLTSFADDVAAVQRELRVIGGPTIVVGHSYGGAVITQAAQNNPNVQGVVYLAAFAPDTGQSSADMFGLAAPLPSQADFQPIDTDHPAAGGAPYLILARDKVKQDACADCPDDVVSVLTADEVPTNAASFGATISGTPAWRQVPAWYQISDDDRILNPDAQRIMASRVDPGGRRTITLKSSHVAMISHAADVARFVERAAAG